MTDSGNNVFKRRGGEQKSVIKDEGYKVNYSGINSPLLQSMYDYSIVPSEKVKHKMDYFYTPYNQNF